MATEIHKRRAPNWIQSQIHLIIYNKKEKGILSSKHYIQAKCFSSFLSLVHWMSYTMKSSSPPSNKILRQNPVEFKPHTPNRDSKSILLDIL